MPGATVKREGDMAVIRVPMIEIHALRVALADCPCGAAKSNATQERRRALDRALARLEAGK